MHPSCKVRKESLYLIAFCGVDGSDIALYLVHLGGQACATSEGQEPHAHHPLCTPAPPFWQLSTWMGYPHSELA